MGAIGKLWETRRILFVVLAVLALLLLVVLVIAVFGDGSVATWLGRGVAWLALAALLVLVLWLLIDWAVRISRRRREKDLDARIAAKEGVEDRKREWARWTAELQQQKIDRYKLPFYLLVGEPQSGKSVMLHNSGLHFPLGQNKLSGPGGTKGCDWWFTDEAVILDLAGRLFTHEGGASDEAEWEAFLKLIADYRPAMPINGVILVIPCDSLLNDSADVRASKAARMKDSLRTLVNKLEAQFPVYMVLTKADRIFGFAESVHRLDNDRRKEMFGWSRSAEGFERPFQASDVSTGFEGLVRRAHLLRAHALLEARIPDALDEVDRLFAFPDEFRTAQPAVEDYAERIFTDSNLVDQLFFRGVYVCCGLQQGQPIVKACASLMGTTNEADLRNLESLFTKQRSYFIHDLIRERIFAERGLVRPTSERVRRSLRVALWGYGTAAAIALVAAFWYGSYVLGERPEIPEYDAAVKQGNKYQENEHHALTDLLPTLGKVHEAIDAKLPNLFGLDNAKGELQDYYVALFEGGLNATVSKVAARIRNGDGDDQQLVTDLHELLNPMNGSLSKLGANHPDATGEWDRNADRRFLTSLQAFLYGDADSNAGAAIQEPKISFSLTPVYESGGPSTVWSNYNDWWSGPNSTELATLPWSDNKKNYQVTLQTTEEFALGWSKDESREDELRIPISKHSLLAPLVLAWKFGDPDPDTEKDGGYTRWKIKKLSQEGLATPFTLEFDRPLPALRGE